MKKSPAHEELIEKLVSDEARRLNAELAERVEEKADALRAARSEMDAFSYAVSHGLRAPLVHIGGFVDLLFEHCGTKLDARGKHYLRTIAESTYKMGRMIDEVLALSRLSEAEVNPTRVDLQALTRLLIEELRPLERDRHISWIAYDLPVVEADPTLLRRVVVHLLSNAIKFTRPRDSARIEVSATLTDEEVIVAVADNGVGFDMKHRHKLFGVFQRLHGQSEFDGAGMGLAQVRRIIERHGGRTWAESERDCGATFYFSLPRIPLPA